MTETTSFSDLVGRLRAGDADAAEELLRRYEPAIRLEVRCRLSDRRLRRVLDSMDVVQAVLGSFFLRAASGQFDIEQPEHLLALLNGMARKKLAYHVRRLMAGCRDIRRSEHLSEGIDAAAPDAAPSRIVAGRELLAAVQSRLTVDERQLAEMRGQGLQWSEIAARVGGTADGRRKQLTRELDRISQELELDADLAE